MLNRLIPVLCIVALIAAVEARATEKRETVPAKYEFVLTKDIIEVLKADGHYSILLKRLDDAKLTEMLRQKGSYTLFAPTDEAFKKNLSVNVPQQDQTRALAMLKNHIVADHIYTSVELPSIHLVTMMSGESMAISATNGKATINGAKIVQADMAASNGVVHGVDTVLTASKSINSQNPLRIPEPGDFLSENP